MREGGERGKNGLGSYQIKKHVLDNASSSSFLLFLFLFYELCGGILWGSSVGNSWGGILDETFENRQTKIGN